LKAFKNVLKNSQFADTVRKTGIWISAKEIFWLGHFKCWLCSRLYGSHKIF